MIIINVLKEDRMEIGHLKLAVICLREKGMLLQRVIRSG